MAAPIGAVFVASEVGPWTIDRVSAVRGESLPNAAKLAVHSGTLVPPPGTPASWSLRGSTGHQRYTELPEQRSLLAIQPPLARGEATCAALIPIRKSEAWWELAQDARRAIFEARSHHIAIGLEYLPAVARRLYHSRELGEAFDFLTWFEFAPEHSTRFDQLLGALRASEEWSYVEREVEIRLSR